MAPTIRAPRGTELRCKGWLQEAALRMLMNNLDPDVAERPEDLVVYGGSGKAARNWEAFHAIVASLERLAANETLLVQSGKPVAVFRTHEDAPRVLLVNSMLVPAWANWETFWELERAGLTMYGQMTAGSWIYIGTQGILQGTYETFIAAGQKHFESDDLSGRFVLSAGLGGMGGAQPLAATMAGAAFLGIEVDPARIQKRLDTGYLQHSTHDLDEALALVERHRAAGTPVSVGLLANAADVYPELVRRGCVPDLVTDQTSAHDMLNGYVPAEMPFEAALALRSDDPTAYLEAAFRSVKRHVEAMLDFQRLGSHVFDYGNNIREQAKKAGTANAFDFPGFVPAYIRPLFCEGYGPFRWVALSGDPQDIYRTDEIVKRTLPDRPALHRWLDKAAREVQFQGLPARICWLGYGERDRVGLAFNEAVARGEISAPIVIGRDHLDCGSVASPNRETEGMLDGSDAIADWPILNAMLNAVNGATWVSVHHGGGVGIGYSIHAGMVIVADGSEAAAKRLQRVLIGDPGMGVVRHVDAGYELAARCAERHHVDIP